VIVTDMMPPGPPKLETKPEELQTQQSVKKKVERLVDDLEKAGERARQAEKQ
jgi:hypothetical protein